MANAYRVAAGKYVHYYNAAGKRHTAKITSVTSQSSVILALVTSTNTRVALNAGVTVPKRTAHGQTNVWRPY
jgi:hypothetical protein